MPPATRPEPADKRREEREGREEREDREEIHRSQVDLVQASLRAGVRYQRPGRVAKAAPKRV